MALPQVGVRFVAENLSGYTSALSQAERANDRFRASVTGASQSNFNQLGRGIQRESGTIRTGFQQAGQSATRFGQTVVSAAGVATAALAGIGVVAAASFARSALDTRIGFDAAISNVGALARATDEELVRLTSTAEELGRTTSFSATQAAEALSFTSLAGFSVDESIQALPGILSVAAAAQSDLADTSDIVTNALSGFRLEANEAGRVGDVLTAGFTGSNTSLEQLGTALSFAAPGAEALGLSIEETTAAIGLFSNAGIQGTRAGTALRGILNRLNAPTGEAEERLRELGVSAFDSQGQFVGLANVLDQFDSALEPLSDQARGEALNTIFGAVAATPFTAILAAGSDELRTFTAEIENAAGVADQVAGRQLDNLAGDITRARSAYEGLQLAVTRRATPALRSFFNNAVIPGLSATTTFIESLNDGNTAFRAFAETASGFGSEAFQFLDEGTSDIFQVDLGDLIDFTFDFSSAASEFSLLSDFITGAIDDTRQEINIADFITFTSEAELTELKFGDFFEFTFDAGSDFGEFSLLDEFITGSFEGGIGSNRREINIADFITFTSDAAVTQFNVGDFFDFTSDIESVEINVADFITFTSDAQATQFNVGDFFDFTADTQDVSLNINDVIVGSYDLASAFGTISISDLITGSLNTDTGEGSIRIGDDIEFEFDLSSINSQIQTQLGGLQTSITGAVTSALAGDFTLELPQSFSFALPEGFAADDLLSVTGGLDSLGQSLSLLDNTLATETGDAGALASFVASVNESIGGLAASIGQADGEAIGSSLTGVVTSITGIFTTLNTIDDLALGGIAGTVGDLATSLLGLATDITTGLDAEAIGETAAQGAADFIGSFAAAFTEPDFPEIAEAASGFVAAIAAQFRTALAPGNLTVVGESIGGLATGIVTQISNTLSNPEFGAQIGQGFSDIIVGITQGLSDVFSGIDAALSESDTELGAATQSFATNFVSALSAGLAEADYTSVVSGLISGLSNALGQISDTAFDAVTGNIRQELAATGFGVSADDITPGTTFPFETTATPESNLAFVEEIRRIQSQQAPEEQLGFVRQTAVDFSLSQIEADAQAQIEAVRSAEEELANARIETAQTASQAAETAQQSWLNFLSFGFLDAQPTTEPRDFVSAPDFEPTQPLIFAPEAQRTGVGTGAGFDEVDIAGSVQDQILTQLNFGDLPDQISTAATDAIATAIPSEPIIDSEAVNTALLTAAQEAIPPETVIDTGTVNETLLAAAQEAIPPTSVPEFPGWESIIEVRPPRIPRFPSWRQVADFQVPGIPSFPGWSTFISFDIPSIPSFPGWERFVGGTDIASMIPPFPGWGALLGGSAPSSQSTPSNIPEFQTGSESVQRTGVALVGEQGPELRLINQGDRIFPAGVTSRILDTARSIASRMPTINSDPNSVLGATTNLIAQTNVNNVGVTIDGGGAEPSGFDVVGLAMGIVDAFATAFSVPSFPGWDEILEASPIRIPRFPGWTNIVGLDDISVQILRTDDGSEIVDDDDDGGREFTGGIELPRPETPPGFGFPRAAAVVVDTPVVRPSSSRPVPPPITSSPIPRPPSIPSLPPVIIPRRPSGGQETGEGLGGPVLSSSLTESNMIVNQPINNTSINLVRNFNLTTNSLRSSETISNDFVLMERLAAVGGIA